MHVYLMPGSKFNFYRVIYFNCYFKNIARKINRLHSIDVILVYFALEK